MILMDEATKKVEGRKKKTVDFKGAGEGGQASLVFRKRELLEGGGGELSKEEDIKAMGIRNSSLHVFSLNNFFC